MDFTLSLLQEGDLHGCYDDSGVGSVRGCLFDCRRSPRQKTGQRKQKRQLNSSFYSR